MKKINDHAISAITDLIGGLLMSNEGALDDAYLKAEGTMSVSIGLKISPDDKGLKVKVGISFTSGRVTDTATAIVNSEQMTLFVPAVLPEEPSIFGSLAPVDLEGEEEDRDPAQDDEAVLAKLGDI